METKAPWGMVTGTGGCPGVWCCRWMQPHSSGGTQLPFCCSRPWGGNKVEKYYFKPISNSKPYTCSVQGLKCKQHCNWCDDNKICDLELIQTSNVESSFPPQDHGHVKNTHYTFQTRWITASFFRKQYQDISIVARNQELDQLSLMLATATKQMLLAQAGDWWFLPSTLSCCFSLAAGNC